MNWNSKIRRREIFKGCSQLQITRLVCEEAHDKPNVFDLDRERSKEPEDEIASASMYDIKYKRPDVRV